MARRHLQDLMAHGLPQPPQALQHGPSLQAQGNSSRLNHLPDLPKRQQSQPQQQQHHPRGSGGSGPSLLEQLQQLQKQTAASAKSKAVPPRGGDWAACEMGGRRLPLRPLTRRQWARLMHVSLLALPLRLGLDLVVRPLTPPLSCLKDLLPAH